MSINADISSEVLDIRADLELVLRGEDGLSAYEVAVKNGFVGTEAEWLASLKGEADRAAQYTQEAREYRDAAQTGAIQAGNFANSTRICRDDTQAIRDGFAPEVANAIEAIQAEKEEAEQKKLLVDEAAENAHLDRVQADADAVEVRHLYGQTIEQKNVATDAAERARRYAFGPHYWEDILYKPTTRDGFGITDVPKSDGTDATGTWDISITGNAATVNNMTVETAVPANAVFTDTTYDTMTRGEADTGTDTTGKLITAQLLADFVATAIANLVNSSPAALDTLKELADALGNDPDFAATMATALAGKLGKTETAVNANKVNDHTVNADVPAGAVFTDTTYNNATTSQAGLMSAEDKTKLDGMNIITGVKGDAESTYRTGNVNIDKANIGLGNVDNTADSIKGVAYAAALDNIDSLASYNAGDVVFSRQGVPSSCYVCVLASQ